MSVLIKGMKMPKNCRECYNSDNGIGISCKYKFHGNAKHSRHPQCPLQDTTELLEALEELKRFTSNGVQVNTAFNKLRKALDWNDDNE